MSTCRPQLGDGRDQCVGDRHNRGFGDRHLPTPGRAPRGDDRPIAQLGDSHGGEQDLMSLERRTGSSNAGCPRRLSVALNTPVSTTIGV
jgi:hypothetical protein